jgi:hypothetical protein
MVLTSVWHLRIEFERRFGGLVQECYAAVLMITRGEENPYLRGKVPRAHITSALWEGGNPFDGMNDSERGKAIAELARSHDENFSRSLKRLQEICRSHNFFQLLSHFGYYDQILLDPKGKNSKYEPAEQNAIDVLQSLILQVPENILQRSLDSCPPPQILTEVNKLLNGITLSFGLRRYGALASGKNDLSQLSEMMRSHTAGVRNEGFPSQVRRTMIELVTPLDLAFQRRRGVKLTLLTETLWKVSDMIAKRINDDFKQRKAILFSDDTEHTLQNFLTHHRCTTSDTANISAKVNREKMSLVTLRSYLTTLWDKGNFKMFIVNPDDWCSVYPESMIPSCVDWVLSQWSVKLGELESSNPDHFFLDNPVWSKPLIQFGPRHYLFALPTLVQSFGRQLLEALIRTEGDLWQKYQSEIKPKFLERFVTKLFDAAAPTAKIFANVDWKPPNSIDRFETDLLVVLDAHALIVECKSGHISASARRGAPMRLEKDVAELIEKPTLQGQRFAELLSRSGTSLNLTDIHGEKHLVEADRLIRVGRINVTLDYFGPLGIQARTLRKKGLISKDLEAAATFAAHELESVVEVLDRPSLLFHYLQRRTEIERANDFLSNEMSLLAMYLSNGFDSGDFEGKEDHAMAVSLDGELDPYFMGKELGRPVSNRSGVLLAGG